MKHFIKYKLVDISTVEIHLKTDPSSTIYAKRISRFQDEEPRRFSFRLLEEATTLKAEHEYRAETEESFRNVLVEVLGEENVY